MDLDEELCLCFHVTRRKVVNFIRIEKPRRAAQLAECFGAGTGCGWCRKYLQQLFDMRDDPDAVQEIPSSHQYAELRKAYIREGKGKPPTSGE